MLRTTSALLLTLLFVIYTQSIPNFSLKGNGNLTVDIVKSIYPSLLNQITSDSKDSCTSINTISYYADPLSKLIAFMLGCPEKSGFTVYEIIVLLSNNTLYFAGKKSLLLIPDNYWQLNVVQLSTALINTVNSTLSGSFAKGLALESVVFVNQITFGIGQLDFVGVRLNDGTTLIQELLFINGSWTSLGMSVVQMGSGVPANDSHSTNNTNNSNSNNSKSNSSSTLPSNSKGYTPPPDAITIDSITPQQVKTDPYIKGIYQLILQNNFVPSYLAQLQINDLKRGIYANGTVKYLIFYGPSADKNTYFMTILYSHNSKSHEILLQNILVFQIYHVIVYSFKTFSSSSTSKTSSSSASSSKTSYSYTSSQTSTSTSKTSYSSSSTSSSSKKSPSSSTNQQKTNTSIQDQNKAKIDQILIKYAVQLHPKQLQQIITFTKLVTKYQNIAIYKFAFVSISQKQYHWEIQINLTNGSKTELQFYECTPSK